MISKLFLPVDRNDNSMSSIQLYAASVFLLILVASLMAFNAMGLSDFARIMFTSATLIGMFSFFLKISKYYYISVLAVIGCLVGLPFLPYLSYAIYLVGALGWAVLIRHEWKFDKSKLLFLPLLFVAIFGSGMYGNFQYQNSLAITKGGAINFDTLFHAAIAAMYGHYGVASVGLDGLVPITYHTLSHKIFAGVATLSGFEALAVYSYVFFAMGPLLLTFSLAGLACQLNSKLNFHQALLGMALLLLAIVSVPVFSFAALWDSYFISESYLLALVLLLVSLSTFIRWVEGGGVGLFQLAASMSLLILAGLAKNSVGLVGICVFGLLGVTKFRNFRYWLLMSIASALLYLGIIDSATNAKQLIPINPFHFVYTYVGLPFHPPKLVKLFCFFGLHFITVWACFVIGLRKFGAKYFNSIEFQVLFALLVPALFFSITFEIAGGAAYYFSSIPVIVSLSFLLPSFSSRLNTVRFMHVIGLSLLATLMLYTAIAHKTFLVKFVGYKPDIEVLQIIKQLHEIRDKSPTNVIVKIENPEFLVSKIGCNAYWFFPAVMERPLIDGLPIKAPCSGYQKGLYGLSDYNGKEMKLISDGFTVVHVKLGPQ